MFVKVKVILYFEVFSWSDHVTNVPVSVRVLGSLTAAAILTIGNGLLASIYLFERGRCGSTHDPKKRTVINSLQSSAALAAMAGMTLGAILLLWRILIGPVSVSVTSILWSNLCFQCCGSMIMENLVESLVLRYLSINFWKSLPPFNEDFFMSFITAVNATITTMIAILIHMTGELENEKAYTYAGLHPSLAKNHDVRIK